MPSPAAPSDSLFQRLKALFKTPVTGWDRVVRAACIFVGIYLVVMVSDASPIWVWEWVFIQPVRRMLDAGFSVSLVIFSIWYGGILTDFYSKLIGFGITDVRVNRRGQDPGLTDLWMKRIQGSKEVTIVGTLSKGWFIQASDDLDEFLRSNADLKQLEVFLLDPFGDIWRAEVQSGGFAHPEFLEDVLQVLRSIYKLAAAYPNQIRVHFYDTDPISCVIARGAIYLGLYLPRTSRKEIPEFTISVGSFLGDKIGEGLQKLGNSAPQVSPDTLNMYRNIMKQHSSSAREQFWSDPRVYCDFCKEAAGIPSTFSRRHARFIGSRLIPQGTHFNVFPTLGQLTSGHALIVPKEHVTSSACLSAPLMRDLAALVAKWAAKTIEQGQTPLVFEHGIPSEDTSYGGCGVCHCHLHLLPIKEVTPDRLYPELEGVLSEQGYAYELEELQSWEDLIGYSKAAYLAVRLGEGRPKVIKFTGDSAVESQLMRRFVASKLLPTPLEWNWRNPQAPEAIDREKQQIKESCERLEEMLR